MKAIWALGIRYACGRYKMTPYWENVVRVGHASVSCDKRRRTAAESLTSTPLRSSSADIGGKA